jgi:hypothetical protein
MEHIFSGFQKQATSRKSALPYYYPTHAANFSQYPTKAKLWLILETNIDHHSFTTTPLKNYVTETI